jgi:hypothetical protein
VRGGVNVVPRDIMGLPVTYLALAGQYLTPTMADWFNALAIRLTVGDLSRLGISKRSDGPAVEILTHRHIPVIDVGTVAAIRSGAIGVRPAIASFARDEVRFVDGRSAQVDAIVLATGYGTGLRTIFAGEPDLLDAAGRPQAYGREAAPGLYFCGFHLVPTGLLREIAKEAVRIGDQLAV